MRYVIILLVFCARLSYAGNPTVGWINIPGADSISQQVFEGNALWGYMNGGADLYLEYGCQGLVVQEIVLNNKRYKVEVYQMNDSSGAFGIYSATRFRCMESNTLGDFSCVNPYQVQVAHGPYYLSIINESGSMEAMEGGKDIARAFIDAYPVRSYSLPGFYNQPVFYPFLPEMKHAQGRLGLMNGFPEWSRLFNRFMEYEVHVLPAKFDGGFFRVGYIHFSSERDLSLFCLAQSIEPHSPEQAGFIRRDQVNLASIRLQPNLLVFIEMQGSEEIQHQILEAIQNSTR
jgi:hypothetical protein